MSSRSVSWRRVGVSAVALITVAAGSPLLFSAPATAAPVTRIVITQDNGRSTAAAGTCTAFTITPTDAFGADANSATVTVQITESPESEVHDVDFCIVDDTTPYLRAPKYGNEESTEEPLGTTQQYQPGAGISQRPADSDPQAQPAGSAPPRPFNNPDSADNANSSSNPQTNADNNNNPNGRDTTSFESSGRPIRFGVVGLQPGAAVDIFAYVDEGRFQSRDNTTTTPAGDFDTTDPEDDNITASRRLTFTPGGTLGSTEANNAVMRVELAPEESVAAKPSLTGTATHRFLVQAFNANNDVVGFAAPRLIPTSGPNSGGSGSAVCSTTANDGEPATCTYSALQAGTDIVTAFFNQSTGTPTFGLDATEPRDTASAVTTAPANVNTAEARNIVLTPEQATVTAGQSRDFTAAVTDASGAPVNGVSVRFDENGPGAFADPTASTSATSTVVMSTTGAGRVTVRFLTSSTDRGSNTITATIATTGTQCNQQASGTTPAGNCSDSSAVTIAAAASPSPSASTSGSPSASPSASRSPSPSASPTGTGTAPGCQVVAQTRLERSTITATGSSGVTVTTTPNSIVDLLAYSRPSTTFRVVRSAEVGADGVSEFRITPPTNTRLFARQRGCAAGPQIVLNVRTQLSLNVVRNGTRNYTFSGSAIPARPNGLIVSLYRVTNDGRQILAAQTRANANVGQPGFDPSRRAGSYAIRRQFTGSGRFGFVVRTGQDLQNAPGTSNVRSLAVF